MEIKKYNVKEDGFLGHLYIPDQDRYEGKVIIAFSGSDGIFALSQKLADLFVNEGLTTMALAYFKEEGLPQNLTDIPLEYLVKVSNKLKTLGYKKIGLWGVSMGAEYALLAASYYPYSFSLVVAGSPIHFVTQGLISKTEEAKASAFYYQQKSLPYTPYTKHMTKGKMISSFIKNKEYSVRFMYDDIANNPVEQSIIPVENMKASLIMFAGKLDSMWPSDLAGHCIMKRLNQHNYSYPHELYVYERGSHYMVPCHLKSDKLFVAERKYKEDSDRYKKDIWNRTFKFIKEQW